VLVHFVFNGVLPSARIVTLVFLESCQTYGSIFVKRYLAGLIIVCHHFAASRAVESPKSGNRITVVYKVVVLAKARGPTK
jgi:hypothetical protein